LWRIERTIIGDQPRWFGTGPIGDLRKLGLLPGSEEDSMYSRYEEDTSSGNCGMAGNGRYDIDVALPLRHGRGSE
jgi:hypothetical protein